MHSPERTSGGPRDRLSPERPWARVLPWAAYAVVLAAAIARLLRRSLESKLWLDDLYTLHFVAAKDPAHLWRGVLVGLDANPPLYATLAWFLIHRVFPGARPELVLRGLGVAFAAMACIALFRIARRFVTCQVALTAVLLFVAWNTGVIETALQLRVYPLFLLLTATSLLSLLRVVEGRSVRVRDYVLLALSLAALAMSHTFGIAYAGCIVAAAVLVGARERDRRLAVGCALALLPATVAFALWYPFLLALSDLGKPYGWIRAPRPIDMLWTVFPSELVAVAGFGMLGWVLWARRTSAGEGRRTARLSVDRRIRVLVVTALLFVLFSLAVWVFSRAVYPIFVVRYFTPNLLVGFAVGVAFARSLDGPGSRTLRVFTAAVAAGCVIAIALADSGPRGRIPCFDEARQTFMEQGLGDPTLPIVTESPHAWFPRIRYQSRTYLFPLDWDVVEKYPFRARNNATDFKTMKRFGEWSRTSDILETEELLRRYREFLVLEQPDRAWWENLRATRRVEAEIVAEGDGCKLWHVSAVR